MESKVIASTVSGSFHMPSPFEAQHWIDDHVKSTLAGRCSACGEVPPCASRNIAHAVLFGAGILPRRTHRLAFPDTEPGRR